MLDLKSARPLSASDKFLTWVQAVMPAPLHHKVALWLIVYHTIVFFCLGQLSPSSLAGR